MTPPAPPAPLQSYTPGPPPPQVLIEPEDVAGATPKDPLRCPLARRLNRQIAEGYPDGPPGCGPLAGVAGHKPHMPYVAVYGGEAPDERGEGGSPGWVRYYHPALPGQYVYMHVDDEDAELVRRYDETGEMPAPAPVRFRLPELARDMDSHIAGIPPEGLPLAEAARVLGRALDPEDDGETPDWLMPGDPHYDTWPRYYCHCSPCILARLDRDCVVDSDWGEWDSEDGPGEGWDEHRCP